MTTWSNERELEFVKIYRGEPILWDPERSDQKDGPKKRHEAWERISATLDTPVVELQRKRDSMMAIYRMHQRKMRTSEDGTVYKPGWMAYDLLNSFLGKMMPHKGTMDTDRDTTQETIVNKVKDTESVVSQSTTRRRNDALVQAGQNMNGAIATLHGILQQQAFNSQMPPEDECDLYGKLLARKLRKLSNKERLKLMHDIDGMFIRQLNPLYATDAVCRETMAPNLPRWSSNRT